MKSLAAFLFLAFTAATAAAQPAGDHVVTVAERAAALGPGEYVWAAKSPISGPLLLTIDLRDLATEEVVALPADPAAFGDAWLRDQRTAVLQVPSLIVPESPNLLFNPAHPDAARAGIVARRRFVFDRRLWLPL